MSRAGKGFLEPRVVLLSGGYQQVTEPPRTFFKDEDKDLPCTSVGR